MGAGLTALEAFGGEHGRPGHRDRVLAFGEVSNLAMGKVLPAGAILDTGQRHVSGADSGAEGELHLPAAVSLGGLAPHTQQWHSHGGQRGGAPPNSTQSM